MAVACSVLLIVCKVWRTEWGSCANGRRKPIGFPAAMYFKLTPAATLYVSRQTGVFQLVRQPGSYLAAAASVIADNCFGQPSLSAYCINFPLTNCMPPI